MNSRKEKVFSEVWKEFITSKTAKLFLNGAVAVFVFKVYLLCACGFQLSGLALDVLLALIRATTRISVNHNLFLSPSADYIASAEGFWLLATDGEASAVDRLCKVLVEVSIQALEGGAVEAVADYRCVADDILTANQFFNCLSFHFLFDGVANGSGHGYTEVFYSDGSSEIITF